MTPDNSTSTEASSQKMASNTSFETADKRTRQRREKLWKTTLRTSSDITAFRKEISSTMDTILQQQQSLERSSKGSTSQAKRTFARVLKMLNADYATTLKRSLILVASPAWILLASTIISTPFLFRTFRQSPLVTADIAMSPQYLEKTSQKITQLSKSKERLEQELVRASEMILAERAQKKRVDLDLAQWTNFQNKYLRNTPENRKVVLTTEGWKYLKPQ